MLKTYMVLIWSSNQEIKRIKRKIANFAKHGCQKSIAMETSMWCARHINFKILQDKFLGKCAKFSGHSFNGVQVIQL